ncbi:MAG: DUF4190 domain-containing protein [Clostridia bacterium]|nr:DUF4190 domain-containing protein [Clostridia bacterium]
MRCTRCQKELDEGTVNCPYCGESQPPSKGEPQKETKNPYAIAGLICSIWGSVAGIFLSSLYAGMFCIPLVGIIASVTGVKKAEQYEGYGKKLAIAGIVISCVGTLISFLIFCYTIRR